VLVAGQVAAGELDNLIGGKLALRQSGADLQRVGRVHVLYLPRAEDESLLRAVIWEKLRARPKDAVRGMDVAAPVGSTDQGDEVLLGGLAALVVVFVGGLDAEFEVDVLEASIFRIALGELSTGGSRDVAISGSINEHRRADQ